MMGNPLIWEKKVNNLTYFMILMNILATEVVLLEILSHRVFFKKAFIIKKITFLYDQNSNL